MNWPLSVFDAPAPLLIGFSGLLVGSFLNVVIHRLPLMIEADDNPAHRIGEEDARPLTLAWPPSHCPSCRRPIRIAENIPLLSYLLLRGRCAGCGERISLIYPVVEALSAVLPAGLAAALGDPAQGWAAAVIVWFLIPAVAIDLRFGLLPDALTLPLLWAGLAAAVFFHPFASPEAAILGAIGGYGLFFMISWGSERYYGRPALGAWLGWRALGPVVLLAAVFGVGLALPGLLSRRLSSDAEVPFGPMLAVAGVVVMAVPELFLTLGMTPWR